jgi:hypothetical protein
MSAEFLLMFLFQGELQDALYQLLVRIEYNLLAHSKGPVQYISSYFLQSRDYLKCYMF